MTHAEAAEYLGISTACLYSLVSYGTLTPERVPTQDGARNHYNFYPINVLRAYKERRSRSPWKATLDPEMVEVAIVMYKNGRSIPECKKFLGVGQTRFRRILQEHGVEIRSKGCKATVTEV